MHASSVGAGRVARWMVGISFSDSSLFITYSSTNHRIRSGISESEYAENESYDVKAWFASLESLVLI